ncbi:metal ABC transporter solute-binding protein, Zn/Mn family [Oceanicella actignis]|uniref:metal ABC transporter solute-binding protein, Zn/Mn family n=1 Tax=Oceanicella actignis TaxID=1189325 RepID=UPI0011E76392|nr:zinc ABC transporter substrate-binding protein [Oceanicella actignis]TYO89624.1 manganese/zinc/iron transport system substrate-binding protein [Oceanicella actignis]
MTHRRLAQAANARAAAPTRRGLLAGAAALALAAAAPLRAQDKPRVVCTTSMLGDMMRNLAGGRAEVRALMGPGIDPHSYRQTRSDVALMLRADLMVWHGLWLEAQMDDFLRELARRKPAAALAESLPRALLRPHDSYPDRWDPHVWMDPALWARLLTPAAALLARIDPEGADAFAAAAERHGAEMAALDAYARETLATVPPERRVLITAHDAFGYFGRAYGFEVMGVQGMSTESEAGLQRIRQLVDVLVSRRVGAVFVESSVSERNLRALIEGAAARGHEVRVGAELYSDAMGPEGSYEGTYLGMIDHNVTAIARALGGRAPARGMRGLLREAQT